MTVAEDTQVFASRHYPGAVSRRLAYGRAIVQPIGTCMLPVMIGALITTLEGGYPLPYLVYGFPTALFIALLWTHYRLRTTIALFLVQGDVAAALTPWESLSPETPIEWYPVLDLRRDRTSFTVTLGYASYDLSFANWAEAEALISALQAARSQYQFLS